MQSAQDGWRLRWEELVPRARLSKGLQASCGRRLYLTMVPPAVSSAMANRCRGEGTIMREEMDSMSKRPRIICHMASSIDGKIDGSALRNIMRPGEYELLHSKLEGDAWICGRTTMQQHFADDEPFVSTTNTPAGSQSTHVARRAD